MYIIAAHTRSRQPAINRPPASYGILTRAVFTTYYFLAAAKSASNFLAKPSASILSCSI